MAGIVGTAFSNIPRGLRTKENAIEAPFVMGDIRTPSIDLFEAFETLGLYLTKRKSFNPKILSLVVFSSGLIALLGFFLLKKKIFTSCSANGPNSSLLSCLLFEVLLSQHLKYRVLLENEKSFSSFQLLIFISINYSLICCFFFFF